jgi:D-alanine-D-alanine ligase
MKLTVGLTYDLRSEYLAMGYREEQVAEFDSDETIAILEQTLKSLGNVTDRIGHARDLCARLAAGDRWDLVFNIAEGLNGRSREAQVPSLLELYGIPYTFSDPLVCAVTLDKGFTKRLIRDAGLPTAGFHVVQQPEDVARIALRYPLFAKPIAEGTGKGIDAQSRIDTPQQLADVCATLLARYAQPVLVEEYLPGREFTVGVLGTGPRARVLGTMEVAMRSQAQTEIYSYAMKEHCEKLVDYRPLAPGVLRVAVEALALRAYQILECRDAARVDIRLDAGERPVFLEINPLAGLHPSHSDLPMIATQEGLPYAELIRAIVASALERRSPHA